MKDTRTKEELEKKNVLIQKENKDLEINNIMKMSIVQEQGEVSS